MTKAFSYHRVSSNAQDTKEQVLGNRRYAEENNVTVLNESRSLVGRVLARTKSRSHDGACKHAPYRTLLDSP